LNGLLHRNFNFHSTLGNHHRPSQPFRNEKSRQTYHKPLEPSRKIHPNRPNNGRTGTQKILISEKAALAHIKLFFYFGEKPAMIFIMKIFFAIILNGFCSGTLNESH
jgi:hypothetical protein